MSARKEIIHGISATRGSAVVGMNKWKTPVLAWQEIMEKLKPGFNESRGFILPPREDKAVFRWGNAFESAIIELAESAQGDGIIHREKLCQDNGTPKAFCYIDGSYGLGFRALHEGKTTFERAFQKSWGEPGTDHIPEHVQIQVQHQMLCSGADQCIVSVLVFPFSVDDLDYENGGDWEIMKDGDKYWIESYPQGALTDSTIIHPIEWARPLSQMGYFHQYPVNSKPDAQRLLREAYDHFWQKYVITETPPELDDYEDIRRLFPSPKGTLVITDNMNIDGEPVLDMMKLYKDINKEIGTGGHLQKKKEDIKVKLLKFCLDKTTVADDESVEKIVFMDGAGNKCGSFNGKTFRS